MKTVEPPCLESDLVNLVCAICAQASRTKDGRKDKNDLMAATGYSSNVVSAGYVFRRTPEVRRNILCAFAELYRLDPARLLRHDERRHDEALQALLELELRKMRCTGDGPHLTSTASLDVGWFDELVDESLIVPSLRVCKACARRKAPRKADTWAGKLKANAARLPTAINQAIAALEASGRALTYEGLSEQSGLPYDEVRRKLAKEGLEKERKGRKNLSRYILVPVLWYLLGGDAAEAAVAAEHSGATSEFIHYRRFVAQILEALRRWMQADRLRRWLLGLLGPLPGELPAAAGAA